MEHSLSEEFKLARIGDWLSWIGQPMLYDGGLCVNRTPEEHAENDKHREVKLVV
ncbi:MAG TPA: hypothetical protein VIY47_15095 [Ignavibacteriaceae bacterium]